MTEREVIEHCVELLRPLFTQGADMSWERTGDRLLIEVTWDVAAEVKSFTVQFAEEAIDDYRDADDQHKEDGDERLLRVVDDALRDGLTTTDIIVRLIV